MNETNINWLHDGTMATISTNDPRIIGQLAALAEKSPSDARMLSRYRDGSEGWTVKKDCVCIVKE